MASKETWVIFEEADKSSKGRQIYSLFSPFTPNKPPKVVSELSGKKIVASYNNGWLVIADSNDPGSIFLFNPFTRTTVDLPRLDLLSLEIVSNQNCDYVMTCVPDDDNDRCVVMVSCKNLAVFCRPGYDDSWGHVISDNAELHFLGICNGIVYKFVFLDNDTDCLVFRVTFDELTDDSEDSSNLVTNLKSLGQLKWTDFGRHYQSAYSCPYLVESCGELYCVKLSYGHDDDMQDVRIFKPTENINDYETMDVVEVESMENQALFIATNNSSFGCYVPPTTTSTTTCGLLQGNCVYILSSFDERPVIFKYQLRDRTLTPFFLFPNHKERWRWRWRWYPFWVTSAGNNRNKRNLDDESEENKTDSVMIRHGTELGDLPRGLISHIATRLSLTEYSRFRATCKKYRDLTLPLKSWSSQTLKIEYFKTTISELVFPWLVSVRGDDPNKICNVIDPVNTDQVYLMTIPWDQSNYTTMEVMYSKNGWLLMHGSAGHLFFYNPFTKAVTGATLPTNNDAGCLRCMGSSAIPISETTAGIIVVGLTRCKDSGTLFVNSYIYGDPEWVVTIGCDTGLFIPASNSPVYNKKKNGFYFLDVRGRLARYQINQNHQYKWKMFTKPTTPIVWSGKMTTYLLECVGLKCSD